MDNIFTNEVTPEEAVQFQTLLDETAAEMKRIRENMRRDSLDIEASQARTQETLNSIRTLMNEIRRG